MSLLISIILSLSIFTAPGISSKQLPVAPLNKEKVTKQTPEKEEEIGQTFLVSPGKSNIESKSKEVDNSDDEERHEDKPVLKRKKPTKEEIEKEGKYEIPQEMKTVDESQMVDGKDDAAAETAMKHELFPQPSEEQEKKTKDNNDGIPALYKDTEVLDYAKKYRGKGKVILDFSRGGDDAKIIVYKYAEGKKNDEGYKENFEPRMEKKKSLIQQNVNLNEQTALKRSVLGTYSFMCFTHSCT